MRRTLKQYVDDNRITLLSSSWQKAVLWNLIAKDSRGASRTTAYQLKSRLISHVIERDSANVRITDTRLAAEGVVGVAYQEQPRLHVRLETLSEPARADVKAKLRRIASVSVPSRAA